MKKRMTFEIKKLKPNDVFLANLLFMFFQIDDGIENPTYTSDEYMKNLLARTDFHILAAVDKNEVIGGLTAYELVKYKREETEMFLYEIGVAASHRRAGVASALIDRLKRICVEKNIKVMFVLAETKNLPAVKLYEKTGGSGFPVTEFDYALG